MYRFKVVITKIFRESKDIFQTQGQHFVSNTNLMFLALSFFLCALVFIALAAIETIHECFIVSLLLSNRY